MQNHATHTYALTSLKHSPPQFFYSTNWNSSQRVRQDTGRDGDVSPDGEWGRHCGPTRDQLLVAQISRAITVSVFSETDARQQWNCTASFSFLQFGTRSPYSACLLIWNHISHTRHLIPDIFGGNLSQFKKNISTKRWLTQLRDDHSRPTVNCTRKQLPLIACRMRDYNDNPINYIHLSNFGSGLPRLRVIADFVSQLPLWHTYPSSFTQHLETFS